MPADTALKATLDNLRRDAGVSNDAERVGQLAWMLFLKILDQQQGERPSAGKRYRASLPSELRWKRWADKDNGLAGDELLDFVDNTLFPGLKNLPGKDGLSGLVRSAFSGARNVMRSSQLLRQSLDNIDEIDFGRAAERREVCDTFEHLLRDMQSAYAGEHYTPRAVVQFMVERVDPKLDEAILDPACGTGGFLVQAAEHLRRQQETADAASARTLQAAIHGIEKSASAYLLAVTNLMLHDLTPNIRLANALMDFAASEKEKGFGVIFVNPPFGGMVHESIEKNFPPDVRSAESLTLFVHLIIAKLRPFGRAAIVVPDGWMFAVNGAQTRMRQRLLEECNLHTIIRLPAGVFAPSTNIRSNLLFFTKGEPTKEIWYYEHPYPAGYKRYSRTKPLRIEDFEAERAWWGDRRETDHAWKVSIDEVKGHNYSLDLRKPTKNLGCAPSRVLWLKLSAFRGFRSLVLELPKSGPAVIIGVNGAGKSTVLQAIAMHLSSFSALVTGLAPSLAEPRLGTSDIQVGEERAALEVMLRVGQDEQVWELRGTRTSSFAHVGKGQKEQAEALRESLSRVDNASVPVLCFYPATRAAGAGGAPARRSPPFDARLEAYEGGFSRGLGPFQDFIQWFRAEEDAENEGRLRVDPEYRNPRLVALRRALEGFLGGLGDSHFSNLRMERLGESSKGTTKTAEMVLDKDGVRLGIEQFSEGERNTILLVADLARRLAIANPALEDPLRGEGVVLIDEIDLHLHPAWQRGIVPSLCTTFLGCQFIVSTHSPQVLSGVRRDNVFILEDFKLVRVAPHTYGRDANSILTEVMGLSERPREIEEKIRVASMLVDEERLDEAKTALDELKSILGDEDNVVVRLRTLASFLEDRS